MVVKLKSPHKEQETDLIQEGAKKNLTLTSMSSLEYSYLKAKFHEQNPVELPPTYFSEMESSFLSQEQTKGRSFLCQQFPFTK